MLFVAGASDVVFVLVEKARISAISACGCGVAWSTCCAAVSCDCKLSVDCLASGLFQRRPVLIQTRRRSRKVIRIGCPMARGFLKQRTAFSSSSLCKS